MGIRVRDSAGWVVVEVSGDLDLGNAWAFRDTIARLLEQGRSRLVLDLDHVRVIDSTGIGLLIAARQRSVQNGCVVRLVVSHRRHLTMFRILGLTKVFEIFGSRPEATDHRPILRSDPPMRRGPNVGAQQ